jgi:hypothetical protein
MTDPEELARQMKELADQKSEPYVIYETIYQPDEEQKKMYFNAGRWAGGARDWTARKAFEKLAELGEM